MTVHNLAVSGALLLMTIVIWLLCIRLAKRLPSLLLGNPLVLGIAFLCLLLPVLGIEGTTYLEAVRPLTFFVGLATVALAVPLWEQRQLIRLNLFAMLIATVAATLVGIGTAWAVGSTLGLPPVELASIAPKMTTLAVALPLSRSTGGWESLTMLAVMFNGIGGVIVSESVWRLLGKRSEADDRAFALGITSHAMGIARTMGISPEVVAFSSCGMLLSALVTTALYGIARATGLL